MKLRFYNLQILLSKARKRSFLQWSRLVPLGQWEHARARPMDRLETMTGGRAKLRRF